MKEQKNNQAPANVIITGASRGLGREMALAFAGGRILSDRPLKSMTLTARNTGVLESVKEEIVKLNHNVEIYLFTGDLSHSEGIGEVIDELDKSDIAYNVLINNAGCVTVKSFENMPDRDIEEQMFVNLIAPVRLTRFFIERFFNKADNPWARIIQISSITALMPHSDVIPYSLSKKGLIDFTTAIAKTFAGKGLTCNTILPGLMATDMGLRAVNAMLPEGTTITQEEIETKMAEHFPENKITSISEVLSLMRFLLSVEGTALHGEYFRVAAGLL